MMEALALPFSGSTASDTLKARMRKQVENNPVAFNCCGTELYAAVTRKLKVDRASTYCQQGKQQRYSIRGEGSGQAGSTRNQRRCHW